MSTRATIAVRRDDQTYDAVYLHFDGYPEHTGELLMKHHQSPEAAEALIAGGDVRCLETDGDRIDSPMASPPKRNPTTTNC